MKYDWKKIQEAFEIVQKRIAKRIDGDGWKVYSLGEQNPYIRVDILKEKED